MNKRKIELFFLQLKRKAYSLIYRIMPKKLRSRRLKSRRQLSAEEMKLLRAKRLRLVAFGFFGLVILGIVAFLAMFAWYSRELPKPGEVVRKDGFSSKIYDRNGQLLYDLYEEERRNPVTFDQIPDDLKHATVAIEDKDFYKHGGFDFLTIVRIPYNLIFRGGRVVGGSTLTQQLVKNVFLSNEKTITRKFKEFVISVQIERKFSKDEILAMYLNESPYGGNGWGVGTAVEMYFNKPINELGLLESAFLAGLPQRPSVYSPYSGVLDDDGNPYWKMRTQAVLTAMKDNGYITELAYQDALASMDSLKFERAAGEIKAPHFVFYVRSQLEEMFGTEVLEKGGLKVTTSLDWTMQEKAQMAVTEEVESVNKYNISNGAALAMNPKTGEILSMVGSKDYFDTDIGGQFNVVVDGLRQPGSSIKPITYLGMIQKGYNPASMLMDVETTFNRNEVEKPYVPKNYDGKFRGPVSLRESLGSSLNIPAVKSLAIVGLENFLNLAYSMGLQTLEPTKENLSRFGFAVTLGGAEVKMIDLVTAYSAFANGGLKIEPVSILKVEDQDGNLLYEHYPVEGQRIIDEGETFIINNILSDNNARLLAFGANSLLNTGKPIAVKTGTTNSMKDNWTIGWSQDVIVGTWVGNNDNTAMSYVASGITGASPIWRRIIFAALDLGYQAPEWKMPDNVERVELDAVSGFRNHDGFATKWDYVIKGTLSNELDPIHKWLKVCKGEEGKLATEAKIAFGDYTEKEFIVLKENDPISEDGRNRWQEGIDAWKSSQTDSRYNNPTEYCGAESDINVNLEMPGNEENISGEDVTYKIKAGSDAGVAKLELYVKADGKDFELKKTVEDQREFQDTIKLERGKYELYAKAYSKSGSTNESGKIKIGTGGTEWNYTEPTLTPTPEASSSADT
ncbi:transglycosylase domain-containing protein [Patescibacteria group bacterium]|nr:transglycosylase domain-containing protein [Patescibacteria group bacterium]